MTSLRAVRNKVPKKKQISSQTPNSEILNPFFPPSGLLRCLFLLISLTMSLLFCSEIMERNVFSPIFKVNRKKKRKLHSYFSFQY